MGEGWVAWRLSKWEKEERETREGSSRRRHNCIYDMFIFIHSLYLQPNTCRNFGSFSTLNPQPLTQQEQILDISILPSLPCSANADPHPGPDKLMTTTRSRSFSLFIKLGNEQMRYLYPCYFDPKRGGISRRIAYWAPPWFNGSCLTDNLIRR